MDNYCRRTANCIAVGYFPRAYGKRRECADYKPLLSERGKQICGYFIHSPIC